MSRYLDNVVRVLLLYVLGINILTSSNIQTIQKSSKGNTTNEK